MFMLFALENRKRQKCSDSICDCQQIHYTEFHFVWDAISLYYCKYEHFPVQLNFKLIPIIQYHDSVLQFIVKKSCEEVKHFVRIGGNIDEMCWLVSHGCWILENKKHYQCHSQTHLFIKSKLHAIGVLNLEISPGVVWQHSVNCTVPVSKTI